MKRSAIESLDSLVLLYLDCNTALCQEGYQKVHDDGYYEIVGRSPRDADLPRDARQSLDLNTS